MKNGLVRAKFPSFEMDKRKETKHTYRSMTQTSSFNI